MDATRLSPARKALGAMVFAVAGLASALPAAAQTVYQYTGNPFTLFSCGPSSSGTGTALCATPGPNVNTSYLATDFVSASLSLTDPLPPSMALTDVRSFAGFALTLSDVRHTVSNAVQQGMFAEVATDAGGNISNWRLVINTGGTDNGGISTTNSQFVSDQGVLRCCDPTVDGDLASRFNAPGTWSSGTPTPLAALGSLVALLSSPDLALTSGQINSLTDKLNNVVASVQAGLVKQAINQLKSFINSVESAQKNGKMPTASAAVLIAAANAIVAMLA